MTRTPEEILTAHVTAVMHGDIPGILKNFSDEDPRSDREKRH